MDEATLFESWLNRWQGVSLPGKLLGILGLLAILGVFVAGVLWAFRANDQILFSDLDIQDAGRIVAELEKMKIPYRLEHDGATILVDADVVYPTRLKLMSKGMVLNGTVGFEIFDHTDFGMTEFAQKINYQRALQGELTRTITSLDEIRLARVHIALPETSLNRKKPRRATASVTLALNAGQVLTPDRIIGIQRLVAASLPDVHYRDVTIIDQQGVALSAPLPTSQAHEEMDFRLLFKKRIEMHLTEKITAILDKTLGENQGLATVDVALDNDVVRVVREDFSPLPSSETETEGHQTPTMKRQRQTTKTAQQTLFSRDKEIIAPNESRQIDIEYQNSRQIEQILREGGLVSRVTIGVMVPDNTSANQIKQIQQLASMAAGLDEERGDAIVVTAMPIGKQLEARTPASLLTNESYNTRIEANSEALSVDRHSIWVRLFQDPLFVGAATVLAVLFGIIVLLVYWGRVRSTRALSPEERMILLEKIRSWMVSSQT